MSDRNLREIASRCEAKLHGFRRTADGVVVSFVVSPIDVPPALALDPLGTRYQLAFCAIGDDEQPLPASRHEVGERPLSVTRPAQQGVIHPDVNVTSAFDALPKGGSQPGVGATALTPKTRYAAMTAGEHARSRAGRLPREDERFRAWAAIERHGADALGYALSEDDAAQFIRDRCCGGKSRKLIAEDPEAMDRFIALETRYLIDIGQITGPR